MTKVYLAARYDRKEEMRNVREVLKDRGYEVISRWIDSVEEESADNLELNNDPEKYNKYAKADLEDIRNSGMFTLFTSADGGGKGGRHVEFGYALGLFKLIIVIGPRENVFHTLNSSFIRYYPSLSSFLAAKL